MTHIDIVFDGPPGPEAGRFVEVENSAGRSVSFGKWLKRADGYWVLRCEALLMLAKAVIDEHENLEDRAPSSHECDMCTGGALPHLRTCAYHQAKAIVAKIDA